VIPTGKDNRILKDDIILFLENNHLILNNNQSTNNEGTINLEKIK